MLCSVYPVMHRDFKEMGPFLKSLYEGLFPSIVINGSYYWWCQISSVILFLSSWISKYNSQVRTTHVFHSVM